MSDKQLLALNYDATKFIMAQLAFEANNVASVCQLISQFGIDAKTSDGEKEVLLKDTLNVVVMKFNVTIKLMSYVNLLDITKDLAGSKAYQEHVMKLMKVAENKYKADIQKEIDEMTMAMAAAAAEAGKVKKETEDKKPFKKTTRKKSTTPKDKS
jgi:hypothetical protein